MKKILIGADPEFFFKIEGNYLASEKFITGEKDFPETIKKGFTLIKDNLMGEFTIPPASSKNEFVENINFIKQYLLKRFPGVDIVFQSKAEFSFEEISSTNNSNEFLCNPSSNIYNNKDCDQSFMNTPTRFAGGHIHIGYDKQTYQNIEAKIIKCMDALLGVPSILLDPESTQRRTNYGRAGEYRLKPYGVEYRTLSNFWLQNDDFIEFAFTNATLATKLAIQGLDTIFEEDIESIINNSQIDQAQEFIAKYDIKLPQTILTTI